MSDSDTIIETNQDRIKIIRFNKIHRKNAIDLDMYVRVTNMVNKAATDDNIFIVVLTGTGDFYSSGNDFSTSLDYDKFLSVLHDFIKAFITFPKLLIAIVNGPAVGIATTVLPLFDFVFAAEKAYFITPFTRLGIFAEGCSTYTFPKIMGERKAAEMLYLNYKMFAEEALQCGFINYIYKPEEIQSKVWDKITEILNLPEHSMLMTKNLLRRDHLDNLLRTNDNEIKELSRSYTNKSKI